jgi:hypothetical protein
LIWIETDVGIQPRIFTVWFKFLEKEKERGKRRERERKKERERGKVT